MAMYMGKKSNGVRRSHVQQGMEGSMAKQNLGMACHTPPLNKSQKRGKVPLPILTFVTILKLYIHFINRMGLRMDNGTSPCF